VAYTNRNEIYLFFLHGSSTANGLLAGKRNFQTKPGFIAPVQFCCPYTPQALPSKSILPANFLHSHLGFCKQNEI
jgi:hypothetical protein